MKRHLIGLDAGGTYIKATLFDEDGRALLSAKQPNNNLFLSGGRCEREPRSMLESVDATFRSLISRLGPDPASIAGVAVTGFGCGLWLLDENDAPLHNGVLSTDTRTLSLIESLPVDLRAEIAERVGSRMFGGLTLPLMLWMSAHHSDVVSRTAKIVSCKDYIRGSLTGDFSTDPSDAGFTGLFDLSRGEWALDVLDRLGIPEWKSKLPIVKESAAIVGSIHAEASRRTTLPVGVPVARGVLDVTACAVASGVIDPSTLLVVAGTFGNNQTLHAGAPRSSTLPLAQAAYVLPGTFLATEGGPTSAGNLEWLIRNVIDSTGSLASNGSLYETCNAWAAEAYSRPTRSRILFLPFVFDGPRGAPSALIGMAANESVKDLILPVFEGIAFTHRRNIEILLSGADAAVPKVVRMSGGGSNSEIWPQIFADVLNFPIEVTACEEMGALGSAIVAAVAVGIYPDIAGGIGAMVHVKRRYEPDRSRRAETDRRYARYLRMTDALADEWRRSDSPPVRLERPQLLEAIA